MDGYILDKCHRERYCGQMALGGDMQYCDDVIKALGCSRLSAQLCISALSFILQKLTFKRANKLTEQTEPAAFWRARYNTLMPGGENKLREYYDYRVSRE